MPHCRHYHAIYADADAATPPALRHCRLRRHFFPSPIRADFLMPPLPAGLTILLLLFFFFTICYAMPDTTRQFFVNKMFRCRHTATMRAAILFHCLRHCCHCELMLSLRAVFCLIRAPRH